MVGIGTTFNSIAEIPVKASPRPVLVYELSLSILSRRYFYFREFAEALGMTTDAFNSIAEIPDALRDGMEAERGEAFQFYRGDTQAMVVFPTPPLPLMLLSILSRRYSAA